MIASILLPDRKTPPAPTEPIIVMFLVMLQVLSKIFYRGIPVDRHAAEINPAVYLSTVFYFSPLVVQKRQRDDREDDFALVLKRKHGSPCRKAVCKIERPVKRINKPEII